MAKTFDQFLGILLNHKHTGSDISDLSDYVGSAKGTFTTAYPATPSIGTYSFAGTDGTTVGGVVYYAGDSAYWSGSAWTRVPGRTASYADLKFNDTPTNPQSGFLRIYSKTIGRLFRRNSSGEESLILAEDGWNPEYPGMVYDGVDDTIQIPDNVNLNFPATPFLQEILFKVPSDITTTQSILYKGTNGFSLTLTASVLAIAKNGVATWITVNISAYVNKVIHVIVGYTGTNYVFYINGQLVQSGVQATNLIETTSNVQTIGTTVFKGTIYLVRFWNLALTATEVLQLYNNGQPQNSTILYKYRGASQVNKVVNGTFDSDTGWVKGSSWTIGGGVASYDALNNLVYISPLVPFLVIGKYYRLVFSVSATARLAIADNTGVPFVTYANYSAGTYRIDFISTGNNFRIYARNDGGGGAFNLDNVEAYPLGAVLELKGENINQISAIDTSGNGLHGTVLGSPSLTVYQDVIKVTTGKFSNNIAEGVLNKDISIPANYYPIEIQIKNYNSNSLTACKAVWNPATDNLSLFSGYELRANSPWSWLEKLYLQYSETSNGIIRINATGNTAGMEITVIARKKV